MFFCSAASSVQKLFASAPEFVERNWNLIIGHLKRDDSTKPGSSSAYSTNLET